MTHKNLALLAALAATLLCAEALGQDTEWGWKLRLRPRAETFSNQHFEASPDNLNYPRPDNLDLITQQSRLTLTARRGDLSALLQLQHVAAWGTTGGDALTDPPLNVHQAHLAWDITPALNLKAGRQELSFGKERVLGAVGWSQVGRAWDGLRLTLTPTGSPVTLDLFGAQYAEGAVDLPPTYSGDLFDEDALLTGAYAAFKGLLSPIFDTTELHLIDDLRIESPAPDGDRLQARRHLVNVGARLDGRWGDFDGDIEGALQVGGACVPDAEGACTADRRRVRAFFFDYELGYKPRPWIRPFLGASMASGDDPDTPDLEAYDHLYPTAHAFLGLMDLIGARTNIADMRVGVWLKVDRLRVTLTGHSFLRLQPSTEYVGVEIDATTWITLDEGLELVLGHSTFAPADGITVDAAEPLGNAQWFVAQLQLSL